MRATLTALGVVTVLTGCASLAPIRPASFADISTGTFDNQAQFQAAPTDMKRPAAAGHPYDWIDLQSAQFTRVVAPRLGSDVLYLEWKSGGPSGPISRQRIWRFRTDAGGQRVMDFYSFKSAADYAGKATVPGAFANLSEDDLTGYGTGCALAVTKTGAGTRAVTPLDCSITAKQSGRKMQIVAEINWTRNAITYQERGVLASGAYAFLVPGGEKLSYEFKPTR